MFHTYHFPFRTRQGRRFPKAIIDLSLDRQIATAMAYTDESRQMALIPKYPMQLQVRADAYDADPTTVAEAVVDICTRDLLDGDFRQVPCSHDHRWTTVTFDKSKRSRWAGWTSKIRTDARATIVQRSSR